MEFETKHIGSASGRPASIIELTVKGTNIFFTEDVTEFKTNKVDENFIMELRQLADELQEHNELVDSK